MTEDVSQEVKFLNSLRTAVTARDVKIVRRLVKCGVDVNKRYWFDGTLLHDAIFSGSTDIIQLLIKAKADVNATNKDGRTPLHLAARMGREDITEQLLIAGARTDVLSSDGRSSLHVAAWKGHLGICRQLVNAGSDVNHRDADGWTPLFWAVKASTCSMELSQLLVENGANINVQNKQGACALVLALQSGHQPVAKYLLKEGADVSGLIQCSNDGRSGAGINSAACFSAFSALCAHRAPDSSLLRFLAQALNFTNTNFLEMTKRCLLKPVPAVKMDEIVRPADNRVWSLQMWCRVVVRSCLSDACQGRSITPAIHKLPLPENVRDFLRLSELTIHVDGVR